MKSLSYQTYLNWHASLEACLWADSQDRAREGSIRVLASPDGSARLDLEKLDWDSSVLGLNAWRVRQAWINDRENDSAALPGLLKELEGFIRSEKIRFCSVRLHSQYASIINAFKQSQWYEADTLKIYFSSLSPFKQPNSKVIGQNPLVISSLSPEDALSFFTLYPNLFVQGRISQDPHIPADKAVLFYRELFTTVSAKASSIRLGLWKSGQLIGVCLGEEDDFLARSASFRLGYLWQIALAPQERGQGYSRILLQAFLGEMARKTKFIEIGTQAANETANRLYQGIGLELVSQAVTLHRFTD